MAISLALIIILGLGADYLFRRLKMPGLVGMLLVGILVGPYVLGLLRPEMMAVSADFRKIALIVILLRAGFTLRRETLNRTARPALLMSFVPASCEIAAVSLAAVYLFKFSWLQAAMLGAIIGAVSPAVVVPMMIYFMEQGKGAQKGHSHLRPGRLRPGQRLRHRHLHPVFESLPGGQEQHPLGPGQHPRRRGPGDPPGAGGRLPPLPVFQPL